MFKSANKWLWGSISTIILGIISCFIYDAIKDKPLLSTLISVFQSIGHFILFILNYPIKIWWLLIFITIILIVLKLSVTADLEPSQTQPDFVKYRKQRFKNWIWTWDWTLNKTTMKWNIYDLNPSCPKCDTQLYKRRGVYYDTATCPRCETNYRSDRGEFDDPEAVELIILDNSNKGTYKINR